MNTKRKAELMDMLCSCKGVCSSSEYFDNLQDIGQELKFNQDYMDTADFGAALASIERLIILHSLNEKDRCVCELEAILNKSQSTISHHLRKLERANLIRSWKKGSYTYYGLKKEQLQSFLKILNNVFNSA